MFYVLIVSAIFGTDWLIKEYVEDNKQFGNEEEILDGNIIINKHHNKGAMLNFMDKKPNVVMAVSGMMLGVIMVAFTMILSHKNKRFLKLGMAFLLGGASSNVADRITKGFVVDYFSFKSLKKVVFNISDIFILLGSLMITICTLFKSK